MGVSSQQRHIARVLAIICGIILIVVVIVARRWSKGGDLGWAERSVSGIWSMGRERWRGWGSDSNRRCYDVRSG